MVKNLKRIEKAWFPVSQFSATAYSPGSTIKFREALTALGAPARLCHRNGRSRTAVAKRISDEPDPARADQGSSAAFGKERKRHWPRSLTAWHDCRCCQTA